MYATQVTNVNLCCYSLKSKYSLQIAILCHFLVFAQFLRYIFWCISHTSFVDSALNIFQCEYQRTSKQNCLSYNNQTQEKQNKKKERKVSMVNIWMSISRRLIEEFVFFTTVIQMLFQLAIHFMTSKFSTCHLRRGKAHFLMFQR